MAWAGERKARLPKNWYSLRKLVLARDRYSCRKCSARATDVDHIVRGDNHHPDNLQALCRECHKTKTTREAQEASRAKRAMRLRPTDRHPGWT